MQIENRNIDELIPYEFNNRTHGQEQVDRIANSISSFGFNQPIVVDEQNVILVGHGRFLAAKKLGLSEVPTLKKSDLNETQKRAYRILDNKLQNDSEWHQANLDLELTLLKADDFDLLAFGLDDLESIISAPVDSKATHGGLADKFLVAPFSVINAREGWYRERRAFWLDKGIRSEEGRSDSLLGADSINSAYGKTFQGKDPKTGKLKYTEGCGNTSIFDPVLCELIYRWFTNAGSLVFDPFAGGSVRGVIAGLLGRSYVGQDIRLEQVQANKKQWMEILKNNEPEADVDVVWRCGDSKNIDVELGDLQADFVFSCPPYGDLEKYSNLPGDISNLDYNDFVDVYSEIIRKSCARLKENRFACFVVGDIRDKKGNYRRFVSDTIDAFCNAGLHLYNEAILVEPIGSRFLFAGRTFSASRKLAKTHQNILIFLKGEWADAVDYLGSCDFADVNNYNQFGEEMS